MSSSFMSDRSGLLEFVPHADLFDIQEPPHFWNINSIHIGDNTTTIEGWCLPHSGRLESTAILVNGRPYLPLRSNRNGVYAELYPWWPNAAWSGFSLEIQHSEYDLRKEVEVCFEAQEIGRPNSPDSYTLDMLVSDLSYQVPPPDVAARIGITYAIQYTLFGRSIYRGFEKALRKCFAKGFADYSVILDWGCGSARLARHVVKALGARNKFTGVDIDSYAVEWSNQNVGNYFSTCDIDPPLAVKSHSVDLVYAYSVFTHMAEENFKKWLTEMARVIKPGGVLLFTVLSDRAMIALHHDISRDSVLKWVQSGVHDSVENSQLETISVGGDYYRNVWVRKSFIEKVFGDVFELTDYVGCFHFYQDLVVARRK
jgi:ubiquinone/menaquinone biosynthesis C-methylase UbiE